VEGFIGSIVEQARSMLQGVASAAKVGAAGMTGKVGTLDAGAMPPSHQTSPSQVDWTNPPGPGGSISAA